MSRQIRRSLIRKNEKSDESKAAQLEMTAQGDRIFSFCVTKLGS